MGSLQRITNRQLLYGAFGCAVVATLSSLMILFGGLSDARRARAFERTVERLDAELRLRDARTPPAGPSTAAVDPAVFLPIADLAARLASDLEATRAAIRLPADVEALSGPAPEALLCLGAELERHAELAAILRDQARALSAGAARDTGAGADSRP